MMASPPDVPESLGNRYRVLCKIETSGQGVVYKAFDTQLRRDVAIKVLKGDWTPRNRRRLHSEAMAAASLKHPYICKVLEVVDEGDRAYLVMEFLDGETLASVLSRGPLDVARTVAIGIEVLEGLADAHAHGLVHRDIKPSNVMVTESGHVKIMDFGLAQASSVSAPEDETRPQPCQTDRHAGTPQYMAPEQARGMPITAQADLFSTGVVLFECLTGQLPFRGTSGYDYVRSVLSERPLPVRRLARGTHPALARLIHRCLRKAPSERPASALEMLAELRRISASLSNEGGRRDESWWRRRHAVATFVTALAVLASVLYALWPPPVPPDRARYLVTWGTAETDSRVSPDGAFVSFQSLQAGVVRLFVQPVKGGETREVSLPAGRLEDHVWSAAGDELACLLADETRYSIQAVRIDDGFARPVADLGERKVLPGLVRWLDAGLFVLIDGITLLRLDPRTGEGDEVSATWALPGSLQSLDVSNDGREVVMGLLVDGREDLWAMGLDGSGLRQLTDDAFFDRYPLFRGPNGAIVFQSNRGGLTGLWELDASRRRQPRSLATGEGDYLPGGASIDGALVSLTHAMQRATLWMFEDTGSGRPLTHDGLSDLAPSVSADGRFVAFQRASPEPEVGFPVLDSILYISSMEPSGLGVPTPVESGSAPRLSPNGEYLAYLRRTTDATLAELVVTDLRTQDKQLVSSQVRMPAIWNDPFVEWLDQTFAWNRLGDKLFFVDRSETALLRQLSVAERKVDELCRLTNPGGTFRGLFVSPDGTRLAYLSRIGGSSYVYLRDLQSGLESKFGPFPGDASLIYGLGWLSAGEFLLLRQIYMWPDFAIDMEVIAVGSARGFRSLGTIDHAFVATARFDERTSTVYVTRSEDGVHNLYARTIPSGRLHRVTWNQEPGVTVSGVNILSTGQVLAVRNEHVSDVWILERVTPEETGGIR
jgi:serine/threonine protein kinase